MPLYGHELGEDFNALSCGVDFAISMDKHTHERGERFIGQDALEKVIASGGSPIKLVGLEIDSKRAARQGFAVHHGGKGVGVVTSGCVSPTLNKSIAMARVPAALSAVGTELQVDPGKGADQVMAAKVVPMPFYKAPK